MALQEFTPASHTEVVPIKEPVHCDAAQIIIWKRYDSRCCETGVLGGAENDCYRQKQQEMASWKRRSLSKLRPWARREKWTGQMNPGHMQKKYLMGPVLARALAYTGLAGKPLHIEWLNIRFLVTNQGSWPMSHRADPILTDNGSSFKVSEAQSNNIV